MIGLIAAFLSRHLVVLVAIVVVPLKFAILRFWNDKDGQANAFLAIPEDLNYVALGLVLGDMSLTGGAFRSHFRGHPHEPIEMLVTIAIGVCVATFTHIFAMWGNDAFNNFRAAGAARKSNRTVSEGKQIELPQVGVDENVMILQARYIAVFSLCYACQIAIVVRWMSWIAKIISDSNSSPASY